jgi:6-phosphogluconolactonase
LERALIPVYIGTYTDGASQGIYRLDLDRANARLSTPVLVARAVNPSFLAWHPGRSLLYAVSETNAVGAERTGALLAYRVEVGGGLALINEEPSGGANPCFVSVHPAGTHAFVANYSAGSVAVFPLRADGGISAASAVVQQSGFSAHPTRQKGPHAHAVRTAPGGTFVIATDLGADKLLVYRFEAQRGTLTPNEPPGAVISAGSGPRHFAAHPSGDAVFLINELTSTLASYAWDGTQGTLDLRATCSTLPDGFSGEHPNTAGEVAVHPSGRFVYGSNRGHDSIAAFRVNDDRTLTRVGVHPTGGKTPRHFAVDPDGGFLLAANQESHSLVLFRIEQETGALADTGARASAPSPAFVGMPLPRGRRVTSGSSRQ